MSNQYSDEEILEYMQRCYENEGECTRSVFNSYEGPCGGTAVDRFGSWNDAKMEAGLPVNTFSFTEQELISYVEEAHEKYPPVKDSTFRENDDLPSHRVYGQRFGSLGRAIAESDVPPDMYYECDMCGGWFTEIGKHWAKSGCSPPDLTDREKDIFTGILMGDGYIHIPDADISCSYYSLYMENTSFPFVEWLNEELGNLTSESTVRIKDNPNTKPQFRFKSRPNPFFDDLKEWYGPSGKRFPEDLELTAEMVRMWYVCDGGLKWGKKTAQPCIYTRNESDREEFILSLFQEKGFDPSWYNTQECVVIGFTGKDRDDILEWMGEPVPGYEYKWERTDRDRYMNLKRETFEDSRQVALSGD